MSSVALADGPRVPIPEQITTERLTLRAPHPDYALEMNAAIAESINELRPWMPWAQSVPTLEQSRAQSELARAAFLAHEDLQLVLFRSERIIGSSGLHRIDWTVPSFEIGYWCRTPDAGQGYITESTREITRFAFEELGARRVEIRCNTENLPSRRIPERLGFELEGILRNDCRETDGSLRNTAIYARVR